MPDIRHSDAEARHIAMYMFVAFTLRCKDDGVLVRVKKYEQIVSEGES